MIDWERRIQLAAHPFAYPLVRGISRLGPAVRVPRIGVVVSDASLAREVLTDTEHFTKTGPGSPSDLWTPVLGPSVLLNMEGEEHARLREKVAPLFVPRYVNALCAKVLAAPLADVAERLRAGTPVDLAVTVQQLAGAVICELVGLTNTNSKTSVRSNEQAFYQGLYAQGTELTSMVRLGRPRLTPRQVTQARAALTGLTAPAAAAFRAGDSTTVPGTMRQLGLTEAEALGAVAAFVLTGTETIVSYLPRLIALCHDNGWLPRLVANRALADTVISEAFRVTVPTPVMLRSVARSTRVGSVPVRPGDRIVIATISCARAHGPFDPDRPHPKELRQLWFGAGPHFCLGMPLAKAEIDAVLTTILNLGGVRIVSRKAAHRVLIPSYERLVVQR
jgi:cytochrome P450